MNWDGLGRRPIKSKKSENQYLRRLTVGLMKVREDGVIEALTIDPSLLEAVLLCRSISEFRGKRRMERTIVNLLRAADTNDVEALAEVVENQDEAEEELQSVVRETVHHLLNGEREDAQAFLEENPECSAQHLRQLVRNAKKHQFSSKTAPYDKLYQLVHECMFGPSGDL